MQMRATFDGGPGSYGKMLVEKKIIVAIPFLYDPSLPDFKDKDKRKAQILRERVVYLHNAY